MRRQALVVGAGIAGLSCAALLARRGWQVQVWRLAASATPVVVLNDVTCDLLRAIWPGQDDLLDGSQALDRRMVRWGSTADPSAVEQASVVIDGTLLLDRLTARLLDTAAERICLVERPEPLDERMLRDTPDEQGWVIDASGRAAVAATKLGGKHRSASGTCHAVGMHVRLSPASDERACWIEAVPGGWLFLAPQGGGLGSLQGMLPGTPHDPAARLVDLVAQSRSVRAQVDEITSEAIVFEAAPKMLDPVCRPGWLAVGDAAVALDPLSGDGTGHAVRGAILAAGVLDGISQGLPLADGLRHYAARLQHTYSAHLHACLAYYTSGGFSAAWTAHIDEMTAAYLRAAGRAARTGQFAYRLVGLDLMPRAVDTPQAAPGPTPRLTTVMPSAAEVH